jgi:hypothetical protein
MRLANITVSGVEGQVFVRSVEGTLQCLQVRCIVNVTGHALDEEQQNQTIRS